MQFWSTDRGLIGISYRIAGWIKAKRPNAPLSGETSGEKHQGDDRPLPARRHSGTSFGGLSAREGANRNLSDAGGTRHAAPLAVARKPPSWGMPIIWWPSFTHLADEGVRPAYIPKGQSGSAEAKMRRGREYEAVVRAVIAEKGGETVVTLQGNKVSGALTVAQPEETLQPGTVVRIGVESPAAVDRPPAG